MAPTMIMTALQEDRSSDAGKCARMSDAKYVGGPDRRMLQVSEARFNLTAIWLAASEIQQEPAR